MYTLMVLKVYASNNGTISKYYWYQTEGPLVYLNNANTATPSFIVPKVSSDTTLKFSLSVKDYEDVSSSIDDVTFFVKPLPINTISPNTPLSLTSNNNNQIKVKDNGIGVGDTSTTKNSINPSFENGLKQIGNLDLYSNKYKDAIKNYESVLSIDPNDIEALSGKGVALYKLHKYKEAITYFDKVLAINPNYFSAVLGKSLAAKKLD